MPEPAAAAAPEPVAASAPAAAAEVAAEEDDDAADDWEALDLDQVRIRRAGSTEEGAGWATDIGERRWGRTRCFSGRRTPDFNTVRLAQRPGTV